MKTAKTIIQTILLTTGILITGCTVPSANTPEESDLLTIREQGSFAVGGIVIQHPGEYDGTRFDNFRPYEEGQTFHGDHAYVFYQKPANPRKYPLIFLHGAGQSSRTWETTPDGREGFQNIFLRKGYITYLVDQPRRGKAGRSTIQTTIQPIADEQMWYEIFRIGIWPNYFDGVQFPRNPESLNQFFRQVTPNTGPFDTQIITKAMSALFDKTGEGILITHSQGGLPGWTTAVSNHNVKAIVS